MTTAVVILNWNGVKHLATYLPSVAEHSQGARVIVADNGSTDDSKSVVDQFDGVEWLALPENYGFAEGYNRALKQVEADIYVLLNSDVRVTANWLNAPLSRFSKDEQVGAVQPKILADERPTEFEYAGAAGGYIDSLGYPYCRGRIFDTVEIDKGQYDDAVEVDWATGACCFVRADAYHALGGLDGSYFAHMEEIDFCWRLRRAGYTCWVEPASTVFHLGGGTLQYASPRKTYLNFRNSLTTLTKNAAGGLPLVFKIIVRMKLDGVAGLQFILKGQPKLCWAIIRAHFAFYGKLGTVLGQRKQTHQIGEGSSKSVLAKAPKSIVFSYFASGKKLFSDLEK
ncbi:MAG: glycosyltransferase family 2 protein [Saprospiraceae bacterium]